MTSVERMLNEIAGTSGAKCSTEASALESHSVDGVQPVAVLFPESVEHISQILKRADSEGICLIPFGSGTMIHIGGLPPDEFVAVDMSRVKGITDFDPENLTVSAQAGLKLSELQEMLAEKRLFVPLDPPFADKATIGGILATNASGALRLLYGSARDFVLGMRVVLLDGRVIKCGGKTVKNVAGYDMNKLFIGSLGTVGVIVEATFRLVPLPECCGTVLLSFDELSDAATFLDKLLHSKLIPASAELMDAPAQKILAADFDIPDASWLVAVRFMGFREEVERQISDVGQMWSKAEVVPTEQQNRLWQRVNNLAFGEEAAVMVKISVPISLVPRTMKLLDGAALRISHAGSGIVYAAFNQEENLAARINHLRWRVNEMSGFLTVEKAPRSLKMVVDVWDSAGKSIGIMRKIRDAFDPRRILNRSRFLGGL